MKEAPLAFLRWKLAQAKDAGVASYETVPIPLGDLQEIHDCFNLMRAALAFYAEGPNYTDGDVPGHIYIMDDQGAFARRALGRAE